MLASSTKSGLFNRKALIVYIGFLGYQTKYNNTYP